VRPLTHQHFARIGVLLEASGDIDGVAADHQLAARCGFATRDDFARVDADPQADVCAVPTLHSLGEGNEALAHGQAGPNRAFGVVLVGLWDPEHGEDGVAGEFLSGASEALDLGIDQLEELTLELANILWIQPLAERRRAGEVGEEDRYDAPLLAVLACLGGPASVVLERDAAVRAERSRGRLLESAGRTSLAQRRAAGTAKTGAARVFCPTGSANQFHAASLCSARSSSA